MRVLYFHQHFTTPRGAGGIRSYQMARELLRRGHRVTMVCGSLGGADTGLRGPYTRGARRGVVDGIDVVEFLLPYSNRDGFLRRAWTFARFATRSILVVFTDRYDLVFATSTPLTAGIPGIVARLVRRKRFVFEVRDLWPELPREMGAITNPGVLGALSLLEWSSYRAADHLVALSPGIAAGIDRIVHDPARITLVPNGCDVELFASDEPVWRPDGVAADDLMAVFAGAHGQANGLDAVLDAAVELRRGERHDIKIVLVGDGKLKASLVDRATREGLSNIVFVDPVKKARVVGLMRSTDVGLQILANVPAFYYGTSPNKFFDYLAAGVPVLTNYPGWLADLIGEHRCGFAVGPDDPVQFADALIRAADDRVTLATMGLRAHALALEQFDRTMLAGRFADALESTARAEH